MKEFLCSFCSKVILAYPSRLAHSKTGLLFCDKSCKAKHHNKTHNPSWIRDISGEKNPMFGKHPVAWNKGLLGERNPNWRGGLHRRGDGYYRINIKGERVLYHRHLLRDTINSKNVIHHKDGNPSNNSLENLQIMDSQSEHAKFHKFNSTGSIPPRPE